MKELAVALEAALEMEEAEPPFNSTQWVTPAPNVPLSIPENSIHPYLCATISNKAKDMTRRIYAFVYDNEFYINHLSVSQLNLFEVFEKGRV